MDDDGFRKYLKFDHNIIIIGFGSVAQAVLPLLFRHLDIKPEQMIIFTKKREKSSEIAKAMQVAIHFRPLMPDNYESLLQAYLKPGDFLLNLSVDVSSLDLIQLCSRLKVIYLDTCIEPWAGGYTDPNLSAADRSNYALRESILALKRTQNEGAPTALVTHGANPGMVSHFLKQALMNLASDNGMQAMPPTTTKEWAKLAQALHVKTIHIAERDTQICNRPKKRAEFVNTWSIDGFIAEGCQPAELGWGTHERHWPETALHHTSGSKCAIYLSQPGAATKVRTWAPMAGAFHGFLITHAESISISDHFTVRNNAGDVQYRPTVHYAYHPCEDAVLSLHELAGSEWQQQPTQRLLLSEIIDGSDELGVLIMGNKKGAYWFGSQLSIHEARALVPHNTATSLQIAVSVLAGLIWAMTHPNEGIKEPDEIDYRFILDIAMPYLGKVDGYYTDWTPLQDREKLFPEALDKSDPWQFKNVLVQ